MPSETEIIQIASRTARRIPLREKARNATTLERQSRQTQTANVVRALSSSSGAMVAYDQMTGQFDFRTNLGGTVRAGSNTTAGIAAGQSTPLNIQPGSPSTNFDARPQAESVGQPIVGISQRGFLFGDNNPETLSVSGRWDKDLFAQYTDDTYTEISSFWIWNNEPSAWVEFSGGGLTPVVGIPTANGTTNGQIHLQSNGRLWIWNATDEVWATEKRVTWGDKAPQWQRAVTGDVHYKKTSPSEGYVCGYVLDKSGYDNGLRWGPMPSNHENCPLPINEDPSDDIPGDYAALCAADAPASFNGTRLFYAGTDAQQFACFQTPSAAAIAQEGYAWYDPETGQVEAPPSA